MQKTKYIVSLSKKRKERLKKLRKKSKSEKEQLRIRVVLLSARDLTDTDVSERTGLHVQSIKRIRQAYCENGLNGILGNIGRKIVFPKLTKKEKEYLQEIKNDKKRMKYERTRAKIILKSAKGFNDGQVANKLNVAVATVCKIRNLFLEIGTDAIKKRKAIQSKFDEKFIKKLIKVTKSEPKHFDEWSLQKLADYMVEEGYTDSISRQQVSMILKENKVRLGA